MSKKALILTWDGFQDQEVIYPYYRVQEEGFSVNIAAGKTGDVTGIFGVKFHCDTLVNGDLIWDSMAMVQPHKKWDLLVIPGGVKALEKLRQQHQALSFIRAWHEEGKIISSTCHGAQMLISAGIVKGKKISGYYSIKDDINNAGATYVDAPVVIDGNIISSPHYKYMGDWMRGTFKVYNERYGFTSKCGCN